MERGASDDKTLATRQTLTLVMDKVVASVRVCVWVQSLANGLSISTAIIRHEKITHFSPFIVPVAPVAERVRSLYFSALNHSIIWCRFEPRTGHM